MTPSANILVVDDEPFNQAMLELMLGDMGHTVRLASSGEEALAKFRELPPDLVLMDVVMPGMSGFDTVRSMRGMEPSWIPIVFITSLNEIDDMVQGIRSGGDEYLLKPLNFDLLQAKINSLLLHQRLRKEITEQNRELLDYRAKAVDESLTAQDFIRKVTALDRIRDPDVQFELHPADNFSGDVIAFARTPSGQLNIMLADSTGHGLAAALNVIPVLQPFYTMTAKGFGVASIATEINRILKDYLPSHRFVAAILASIDSNTRTVQVWNGGMPPAVLLNPDGMAVYQFDSTHLPLGVLRAHEFDDKVEQFFFGSNDCQLFTCSDGAVDAVAPKADMLKGMQALLGAAFGQLPDERLGNIWGVLERRSKGSALLDDIAIMLVDCHGNFSEAEQSMIRAAIGAVSTAHAMPEMLNMGTIEPTSIDWQMDLRLTPVQLRKADVVPILMMVVNNLEIHTGKLASSLFVTMSELFTNALDHGILQLDSMLKQDNSGMEQYYEERLKRLDRLAHGELNVRLEKFSLQQRDFLRVTMRDSGNGFDHEHHMEKQPDADSLLRHGRGISLMKSLCYSLRYVGKGNEVEALLLMDAPELQ